MTAAGIAGPTSASPRAPAPVTPLGAGVMLAGAMLVAALLSVTLAGLFPGDDDGEVAIRSGTPVPAWAAPAPALVGVPPAVSFEVAGPGLPAGALGPWEVVAGAWAAAEGTARATEAGPDGALAVVDAAAEATAAQVTLVVPRPGAGLVVSYAAPDRYVALVVGRSGATVEMVAVEGDPGSPRLLATAPLASSTAPLVLAVQRGVGGVQGVANGEPIGRRAVDDPDGPWRIGLVTGFRARATEARFDDLTVG